MPPYRRAQAHEIHVEQMIQDNHVEGNQQGGNHQQQEDSQQGDNQPEDSHLVEGSHEQVGTLGKEGMPQEVEGMPLEGNHEQLELLHEPDVRKLLSLLHCVCPCHLPSFKGKTDDSGSETDLDDFAEKRGRN